MARVHLTSVYQRIDGDDHCLNEYRRLDACQRQDRLGGHERTEDPSDADIVLFAELANYSGPVQDRMLSDPIFIANADRSVHFNPRLKVAPIIPGIYGSALRRWCYPGHACTSHYLETTLERDYIVPQSVDEVEYLYSFCGSPKTWKGRRRILSLTSPDALLIDSSRSDGLSRDGYRQRFVDTLTRSHFVLCPRGVGPASLRVFEVLRAGRVPVIISDAWLPPTGPDWSSFSVTVSEAGIEAIPQILKNLRGDAVEMGIRAREAHENWFAADVSFQRIVDWALEIQSQRRSAPARTHRMLNRLEYKLYQVGSRLKKSLRKSRDD